MFMLSKDRGFIAADTIAQLAAAYVGSSQANVIAYVAANGASYRLAFDAGLSDNGSTVIESTGTSGAFWVLTNIASTNSDADSLDWYVNSVSGNDDNDGITPATPLKTVGELGRRISNASYNAAAVNVHVQAAVATNDQLVLRRPVDNESGPIYFFYDPLSAPAGLITGSLTSVQNLSRATGARIGIENDNHAFDWTSHVGEIVEMTSGVASGAWGRVNAPDSDPAKLYIAVMSEFAEQGIPTATNPNVTSVLATGDGTFKMYARPSFPDTMIIDIPGQVWFKDFDFVPGTTVQDFQSGAVVFIRCTSSGASFSSTGTSGTYFSFQGSYFNDAAIYNPNGGCVYNACSITTPPQAKILQLEGDTELLDLVDPLQAAANGGVLFLNDVNAGGANVVGGAIVAQADSTIAIEGYLYGRDIDPDGAGNALIRMSSWSKGYYTDGAKLTASVTAGGNVAGSATVDFQGASGKKALSALPFVANATANETQSGFILKA